jgi:hypothetical protein
MTPSQSLKLPGALRLHPSSASVQFPLALLRAIEDVTQFESSSALGAKRQYMMSGCTHFPVRRVGDVSLPVGMIREIDW